MGHLVDDWRCREDTAGTYGWRPRAAIQPGTGSRYHGQQLQPSSQVPSTSSSTTHNLNLPHGPQPNGVTNGRHLVARVLVIDDNVALLRAVERYLTDGGHQVVVASGGMDGMRRWREGGADIVLMDIHMPDFDGIELLAQFRGLAPALPVIMMSGGQQTRDLGLLGDALLLGARATLSKPFTLEELDQVLGSVLPPPEDSAGLGT